MNNDTNNTAYNQYEALIEHLELQKDMTLTIAINVSVSALRKGLRKALHIINASRGLLELELLPEYVAVDVITEEPDTVVKISLLNEAPERDNRFASKFQFSVVKPEDFTNDNNSTTTSKPKEET